MLNTTGHTIITPQSVMSSESHIDGLSRFRKTFDGTSKIAYEKKKTVKAMLYWVSLMCRSASNPYSCGE